MRKRYDKKWFIDFLSKIPGENWTSGMLWRASSSCGCLLYHLGVRMDPSEEDYILPDKKARNRVGDLYYLVNGESLPDNGKILWHTLYRLNDDNSMLSPSGEQIKQAVLARIDRLD